MNTEVMFSSKKDNWETPQDLFDKLDSLYHFETDLAATPDNAKCKKFFTPEQDSLKQTWEGCCWCNPPYGRNIGEWVKKAALSDGEIVMLLPARTDTAWFHDWLLPYARIEFIRGRLKFSYKGEKAQSAPFPSMLVFFNERSRS